jgi:UDP-N-acetylglucosamine:LPS N-acetylglucosamine transferase
MTLLLSDNGLRALLNFRLDVINHFLNKNYNVVLVYPKSTSETELVKRIPEKCKVYEVQMSPTGNNPLKDFSYFRQLKKIFKTEKPDIVFNYTIKPNIYGTFAAKQLKIKVVDMVAGLGYVFTSSGIKNVLARLLYKTSLRLADKVIVLNSYNYDLLLKEKFVLKEKLILFKSGEGVNLEQFTYEA